MRRTMTMLGIGVLAGVGLVMVGWFIIPYIALWLLVGALTVF